VTKAENDRRAGIYVRISQDREGERWGVERQEQDCRKLAERLGWTVVEVFDDNDWSAYNQRRARPAYKRMWADVESGRIDAVLAVHTDRLYRRMRDLVDIIDLLEKRDVVIKTTDSGDLELIPAQGVRSRTISRPQRRARPTGRVSGSGGRSSRLPRLVAGTGVVARSVGI